MQSSVFHGRSSGNIALGAAFLALGMGLSWWGIQSNAPGGALVIFISLLLGGLVRLLTAVLFPPTAQAFVYCWQCAAQVRPGSVICLACGATQPTQPAAQPRAPRYTGGVPMVRLPYIPPRTASSYQPHAPHAATPPQSSQSSQQPYAPAAYAPPQPPDGPASSLPLYRPTGWDEPVSMLEVEEAVPLPPPELPPEDSDFEQEGSFGDANGHVVTFE